MVSQTSMRPPMSPAPSGSLPVPSLVVNTWKFKVAAFPFQPASTSALRSMENSIASSSELK